MRVETAGLPLLGDLLPLRVDQLGQQLDRRSVTPVGRLLDRGLEVAAEHERDLGVEQPVELLRVQLEVVRLGPDRREVGDGDARPTDLLGRERDGIERRHHTHFAAGRARGLDAERGGGDSGGDEQRHEPSAHNENESYHTGA